MVKWLLGVWTAWAAGIVAAHLVHFSKANLPINAAVIVGLFVGLFTALLYGYNLHLLSYSDRFRILKSLFPATVPNLYAFGLVVLGARYWSNSAFWLFAAASVLIVVLGLTTIGWRRRWPEMYLLALIFAGILATGIHFGTIVYFWDVAASRSAEGSARWNGLFTGLCLFGLPGLWAALACTAAALIDADPRSSAYRRAPVAYSVVTKISAMEEDEKRSKQPNRSAP